MKTIVHTLLFLCVALLVLATPDSLSGQEKNPSGDAQPEKEVKAPKKERPHVVPSVLNGRLAKQKPLEDRRLAALEWFEDHQSKNGSWSPNRFESASKRTPKGAKRTFNVDFDKKLVKEKSDLGHKDFRVGLTGLVLLAFVGDGFTHQSGRFASLVDRAKSYLMRSQQRSGLFGTQDNHRHFYGHVIATQALAELFALSGDKVIQPTIQSAVDFIMERQVSDSGWRYGVNKGDADSSVTAFAIMALFSAKLGGFKFDSKVAFDGANEWFKSVWGEAAKDLLAKRKARDSDLENATGYFDSGRGNFLPKGRLSWQKNASNDAANGLVQLLTGSADAKSKRVRYCSDLLLFDLPVWHPKANAKKEQHGADFIYWYIGSMFAHRMGGKIWGRWGGALFVPILLDHQRGWHKEDSKSFGQKAKEGRELFDEHGSWDPVGLWGEFGGRVMSTALATLTLQTQYRFDPSQIKVAPKILVSGNPRVFLGRNNESKPNHDRVLAALQWLSDHQDKRGAWSGEHYLKDSIRIPKGAKVTRNVDYDGKYILKEDDVGEEAFKVGLSGLALLAFVGDGHTHKRGLFRSTIVKGLGFLKSVQTGDGCFGSKENEDYVYNHATATTAIVEIYALTNDKSLRSSAQTAVDFIVAAQNPALGWRYGIQPGENDSSITGWMILALRSAQDAGLHFDRKAVYKGANAWFKEVYSKAYDDVIESRKKAGGAIAAIDKATGYQLPGEGNSRPLSRSEWHQNPAVDADNLLCRMLTEDKSRSDQLCKDLRTLIASSPPKWLVKDEKGKESPLRVDFVYWWFGSMAMYQAGTGSWSKWQKAAFSPVLLKYQRGWHSKDIKQFGEDVKNLPGPGDGAKQGRFMLDEHGSWDCLGPWCSHGGRVYSTALGALTLQTPYRYARVN